METALILGATSDIGIAIAKKFADQKYNVQLGARKPELLQPLESDIKIRYGVDCSAYAFDALQFQSHEAFFTGLNPKPSVTIVVFGVMDEEDEAFNEWEVTRRMIDTNFTGAVSILNIIAKH